MKEPVNDAERLSALLDGQLSDRERDELLAQLAISGEAYHVFAETAAMLREIEAEDELAREAGVLQHPVAATGQDPAAPEQRPPEATPPRVFSVPTRAKVVRGDPDDAAEPDAPEARPDRGYPLPPRRGGWRRRSMAGAAVLMLALASGLFVRGRNPASASPVEFAAALGPEGAGLPAGWLKNRGWDENRGFGDELGGAGDAASAGAMLVDLSVAVRGRDVENTRTLAGQINSRYLALPLGTGPFGRIEARATDAPEALLPLVKEGTARLEEDLGRDPLKAGAWVEAATLAAHGRNEEFFRARATRTPPRALEPLVAHDEQAKAALDSVRTALAAEGTRDWGLSRIL
ncbi:hypothetical protein [Longimicrobium terrae]|uniref:hypothetical protein n=1 Tax=Longimicrobium terrae TaxID=1639882 RepID=UPI001472E554|nr:hypothetical protein [Longimicrobium terrae]NNC29175.1 hypothetical protein [Longimicrobium terrae]